MDLRLSEEQELLRATAREFLQRECPPHLVRALADDPHGHSPALWEQMAAQGWLGAPFPETCGGADYSFLELCLLIEEQGRVALPGPFLSTVVLCGLPLARFGSAEQQAAFLPAIAGGRRLMAWVGPPAGVLEADPEALAASPADGGFRLHGRVLFVADGLAADHLLVAARTGSDEALTLFLVDAAAPGIERTPQETFGTDRPCEVRLDGVTVPAESVLGPVGEGGPIARQVEAWGTAAICAAAVGGAQQVLEMCVAYAGQRMQFGRPIGSFQAVQHHCANMAVDVAASRYMAYEAVWRLSEGLEAAEEVAVAKAWVSDAYARVCALGHQVHGAVGFTMEHEMQRYFRHARAVEQAFGDGAWHREQVARQLGI